MLIIKIIKMYFINTYKSHVSSKIAMIEHYYLNTYLLFCNYLNRNVQMYSNDKKKTII